MLLTFFNALEFNQQ